jgi:uncharacterized protein (DUF2267 family)
VAARRIDHQEFLNAVEEAARLPRADAERAVRATLNVLAERLSYGEARDVAAELPEELRPLMADDMPAQRFGLDEFFRRVAEREGVDVDSARAHVRAVFGALGRALDWKELHDIASELPREFDDLIAEGERQSRIAQREAKQGLASADDFVQRVGERARLAPEAARRATEAVLEALADRISGGEVDDLEQELPPELRPPLERGKAQSHDAARPLSLGEFLREIGELEGATPDDARKHARAVFATLREAISDKEFGDVVSQLPSDYTVVLARA